MSSDYPKSHELIRATGICICQKTKFLDLHTVPIPSKSLLSDDVVAVVELEKVVVGLQLEPREVKRDVVSEMSYNCCE